MSKIANISTEAKWLMNQEHIEHVVNSYNKFIAEGRNTSISKDDLQKSMNSHVSVKLADSKGDSIQVDKKALSLRLTQSAGSATGRVAVIDLHGTFFTRYDWFVYFYGGVAMDMVGEVLDMLDQDSGIDGVILNIDSNGGSLAGTELLAKKVAKFTKPILALCDNNCHSAAYWVASQCDEIYSASLTTYMGSIGVMMRHINQQKYYEQIGYEVTYISAPQSNKKIIAPDNKTISEDDMNTLLKMLGQDAAIFINQVKKGRGDKVDIDAVSNGDIFNSTTAKKLGLHDGIAANGVMDLIKKIAKINKEKNNGSMAESNNNNISSMKLNNLNLETKSLSVGAAFGKGSKMVIVETAKLVELDEKFKDANLGDYDDLETDEFNLNFEGIGINATKATVTNVLKNSSKVFCLVSHNRLAALDKLAKETDEAVVETQEEVSEEVSVNETVEEATPIVDSQEETIEEEVTTVAEEEVADLTEENPEEEVPVVETQEEVANSSSNDVSAMLSKMEEMMASMSAMSEKVAALETEKTELSAQLEENEKVVEVAIRQKTAAENIAAEIKEKAAKVQKKFGNKMILSVEPASEEEKEGRIVSYQLGSGEARPSAAIKAAKAISANRNINKKGAIYKPENQMEL